MLLAAFEDMDIGELTKATRSRVLLDLMDHRDAEVQQKETRHDVEPAAAQRRHFDQLTAQELYSTHDSDIRPDSLSGDAP